MSNYKDYRQRVKEYKKSKFPLVDGVYISGLELTGLPKETYFSIYFDPEENVVGFLNVDKDIVIPVDRIKDISCFTETEIEQIEKNKLMSGLVAGALINPLAGVLVGTGKKKKKKANVKNFLSVLYTDKEGEDKVILFQASPIHSLLFYQKFVKEVKPYIPSMQEESGPIEL